MPEGPKFVPLDEVVETTFDQAKKDSENGGHDEDVLSIARQLGHNDPGQMVRYKETGGRGYED